MITTSSKNALILHVLKEYSYSSDVSKKKKEFFLSEKKICNLFFREFIKKIVPSISIPIPPSENSKKYFRVVKFSKMLPTFYRTTTKNENIQFLI